MFRPRVIPCLLLRNNGLVKSVKFKDYTYVGDPLNAVKIFNEKKADELVFLDITATKEKRCINLNLVKNIGEECNMPFAVGGGISSVEQIRELLKAGAEKVCINSYAYHDLNFIKKASDEFGSSTIVVSIDVKKNIFGKQQVYINAGTKSTGANPVDYAQQVAEKGAGEIIINSVDCDGAMTGYDTALIKKVADAVDVPVVALGGAGSLNDLKKAVTEGNASAVAAGSLFVFHGSRRAVLINFPTQKELVTLFE
ncbi:MAG TPA: AglZ/HisF2 family acetamidino modification protein [Bacteroidales bacterium]|nr:AglZ/HisF2 family acetamidino modification protein [Bacteroidales bacterium]HPS15940.1 AglZ/HisF2 family acetamidino modification protein [Bacteroidales bacterium]